MSEVTKTPPQTLNYGINYISNFYQSYSGTDTLVFIMMPGSVPVVLGSITTISYSLYRTKQPVVNLGRTNINGATRGVRIYAGSMIFTLINQHWLRELQDTSQLNWLKNFSQLKADELPLFDLMIVSANEYGSYVSMFLYGVDITDEGQVVSVNDLFTENTCTFIARDIETFKAGRMNEQFVDTYKRRHIVNNIATKGWDIVDKEFTLSVVSDVKQNWDYSKTEYLNESVEFRENINLEDESIIIEKSYKEKEEQEVLERSKILTGFTRDLEYKEFNPLVGDDVGKVQLALKELNLTEYVNNVYDLSTYEAVKEYQSSHGFNINGIVDSKVFIALLTDAKILGDKIIGNVINKSGAHVFLYADALNSNVVAILNYGDNIEIIKRVQNETTKEYYYQIKQGYVKENDIYSYYFSPNLKEFPTISSNETGYYVLVLQQLLITKYNFKYTPGVYDTETERIVAKIQEENNINCTIGVVNDDTWRVIESITDNKITDITTNNISVISGNQQGTYSVTSNSLNTILMKRFDVTIISPIATFIKAVCIGYYPDGKSSMLSKGYTVSAKQNMQIPFSDFNEIFTYSIEHNSIPQKVEYIIYPSNGAAFKWVIHYKI